jgi:hypothetical protein
MNNYKRSSARDAKTSEMITIGKKPDGFTYHRSLPDYFLVRASLVYALIGSYSNMTFNDYIFNFQKDVFPEDELEIWEKMALAFLYLSDLYGADKCNPTQLFQALLMASTFPKPDNLTAPSASTSVDNAAAYFYWTTSEPGKLALKP